MKQNFDEQAVSSDAYMKKNYKVLFIHPDDIDDLGAIINCAVRYCIGRESYMPKLVVDFIKNHPQFLTPNSTEATGLRRARETPLI